MVIVAPPRIRHGEREIVEPNPLGVGVRWGFDWRLGTLSLNEHDLNRLTEAADRVEIMETLSRYHHLIDSRQWVDLSTVFADDAESIYIRVVDDEIQTSPPVKGISAIRTWLESSLRPVETMHYMANHVFTSIDQDRAHTRSYLHVRGTQTGGIYEADHVKTAHGWRIAKLSLEQHFSS